MGNIELSLPLKFSPDLVSTYNRTASNLFAAMDLYPGHNSFYTENGFNQQVLETFDIRVAHILHRYVLAYMSELGVTGDMMQNLHVELREPLAQLIKSPCNEDTQPQVEIEARGKKSPSVSGSGSTRIDNSVGVVFERNKKKKFSADKDGGHWSNQPATRKTRRGPGRAASKKRI